MSQKVITIGSSIGAVFPKALVDELEFIPGQEISVSAEGPDRIVIERKRRTNPSTAQSANLVKWAAAYVEKYRKDFEALADK